MTSFTARAVTWWTILRTGLAELCDACRGVLGAGDGLSAGLLSRGVHGTGRLLVVGGQRAGVRLYAVQLFSLRPHVSARHAAQPVAQARATDAADVSGLLP